MTKDVEEQPRERRDPWTDIVNKQRNRRFSVCAGTMHAWDLRDPELTWGTPAVPPHPATPPPSARLTCSAAARPPAFAPSAVGPAPVVPAPPARAPGPGCAAPPPGPPPHAAAPRPGPGAAARRGPRPPPERPAPDAAPAPLLRAHRAQPPARPPGSSRGRPAGDRAAVTAVSASRRPPASTSATVPAPPIPEHPR